MKRLTPNEAKYQRWLAVQARRRRAIVRLCNAGWTQAAVALKYGISRQRVNAIIKRGSA